MIIRSVALFLVLARPMVVAAAEEPVDKPTVAVLEFTTANAPAGEASIISDFVRQAVIRSGKFRVVEKKNMDKILSEQAFQQTGCTTSECAVKLGKLLNTRKMVVGELSALAGVRYLTASLVDVETGEIERTARVKEFDARSIDVATDKLVSQLAEVDVSVSGERVGTAPAAVAPALRGRWGVSLGVKTWPLVAKLDFRSSPTTAPGMTAAGPFSNASIDLGGTWIGPVVRAGYRGPFKRGGRLGFGVEGELAGSPVSLPDKSVVGTASNGQPVTFTTEFGGVDVPVMFGGSATVIWNTWRSLDLWIGARVNAFRVSGSWNSYEGPGMPGPSHFGIGEPEGMSHVSLYGELGAEWLFGEHLGVEVSLDVHTGRSTHALRTWPTELSFTQPSGIFNAAVRGYF